MGIQEFLQNGQYNTPVNTPTKPLFDMSNLEIVKAVNEFNSNTKVFFQSITNLIYYFKHPKEFSWIIWMNVVKNSFAICMFICLFSVIAYIIGWEKGKVWAKGSVIAYIIIMMFNSAL